jgi:chromosome segregation ATPase
MFKLKHVRKLEEIIRELPENIRGPTYEAFISFKEDVLLKETREIKDQISRVWEVIKELTEAQRRTSQEIEKIWNAIKELTEAQKRTEEAQRRTEEELASFRKTTEENFNKVWTAIRELAEAQKRTEEKVQELAEAQKKTEESLKKLIEDHRKTREKLEGLSDSFGYLLEDRAMKSLPKILKENYNFDVVEKLRRDYIINLSSHQENLFFFMIFIIFLYYG